MLKYNIEGGLDFFSELYKSLDDVEDEDDNSINVCLITDQPLTENFVELSCGHKFNYIPLYKDIVNHKIKFNSMEGVSTKLSINEIRCPYCRKRHTMTLPFHEEMQLEKIYGVNTLDPIYKPKSAYNLIANANINPCSYNIPNLSFDETKPESSSNLKFHVCGSYHSSTIYIHNNENPSQPITYGDNNLYCYKHKKIVIKGYKLDLKLKEQQAKKKAKEELKKTLAEEKQKKKDEAKALKEELKKTLAEEKQKKNEETKALKESLKKKKTDEKKVPKNKQSNSINA
jgi:hypothetical protein